MNRTQESVQNAINSQSEWLVNEQADTVRMLDMFDSFDKLTKEISSWGDRYVKAFREKCPTTASVLAKWERLGTDDVAIWWYAGQMMIEGVFKADEHGRVVLTEEYTVEREYLEHIKRVAV